MGSCTFIKDLLFYLCVYMCVCVAGGGNRNVSDDLDLQLQVFLSQMS